MQNNRTELLTAFNFMQAKKNSFTAGLKTLIEGNQVRLTPHTAYIRKDASGAASSWDIIDANTTQLDGIATIKGNALSPNQALIFDRISIGYAEGSAPGKEGEQDYSAATVPAVLRNADLVIEQNNREVLNIPVADLVKGEQSRNSEDHYYDLKALSFLADNTEMTWRLKFPKGSTFTPAVDKYNYIEIRLKGFKTSRKVD